MKNKKNRFMSLRRSVQNYNKALIYTFSLFMLYALIHSLLILDCGGIDFYSYSGQVTKEMITCDNFSPGFLVFFRNNHMFICLLFLVVAIVFLVLQKLQLLKINKIGVKSLDGEKVVKNRHVLETLLFGYTGFHKFQTRNYTIANIFAVNFAIFFVTWFVKHFFQATYNSYLMIYCAYEFSVIFIIGIIILCIIDAVFSFISETDSEGNIFA